jgi:hypothetical protein
MLPREISKKEVLFHTERATAGQQLITMIKEKERVLGFI